MSPLLRTSILSIRSRETRLRSPCLSNISRLLALQSGSSNRKPKSFESLGLDRTIVRAVQEAFPNVQHPTVAQEEYIAAILSGKDVLLKGHTGSGKSFGLLLALLNLERRFVVTKASNNYGNNVKKPLVGSLVITPHRDLAYQFLHWLRSILDATAEALPLSSLAQVMLRSASTPMADQVAQADANRPQILIGTPQAVLEALGSTSNPLDIRGISAVVIDEADYLLESIPKKTNMNKLRQLKAEKKFERHPSPTRQILDYIYAPVREKPKGGKRETFKANDSNSLTGGLPFHPRPQLILSSATLRANFRNSVMHEGWLTPTYGDLVKVGPSDPFLNDASAVGTLGGTAIQHCALIVADDGNTTNISGAVDPITADLDMSSGSNIAENELPSLLSKELTGEATIEGVSEEEFAEFASQPSPFNQSALEAIGVAFAVDVPRVALLVLPAEASVRRAVFDLRTLGVNAHGLDVLDTERGGAYLLRTGTQPEANPALLVATLATVRGLDLPDLTHVFMLGIPRLLTADTYLHVAGRVGRFGKSGKVITILEPRHEVLREKIQGKVKTSFKDEPAWVQKIYRQIEVTPTKFEHFDDEPIADASRDQRAEDELSS